MELTRDIVLENTEEILQQEFGADDAVATVESSGRNEFTLNVWYSGELYRDYRPFTYEEPESSWTQIVGIDEHIDDSHVKVHYIFTPGSETLPAEPFIERFNFEPTHHDRIYTKNDVTHSDIKIATRLTIRFPSTLLLSRTDIFETDVEWGYIGDYDILTLGFDRPIHRGDISRVIREIDNEPYTP